MEQIKNSPEIAPSDISELMESVAAAGLDIAPFTPKPVKKVTAAVSRAALTNSAPPVVKLPVKLYGTPLKRDKVATPGSGMTAAAAGGETEGAKRRVSKRSLEEEPVNGK